MTQKLSVGYNDRPSLLWPGVDLKCVALPINYGIVVFPSFQALDVFGPLDGRLHNST